MTQNRRRTPAEVAGIDPDLLARLRPSTEELARRYRAQFPSYDPAEAWRPTLTAARSTIDRLPDKKLNLDDDRKESSAS